MLAIFSCILQFFLSIITNKIYSNKKLWLFYGSLEVFKDFKKEIGFKNRFNIKRIRDNCDIKKLNFEELEGIILDNKKEINKLNLDQIFFKSKGIKVLNVLKWFENELHRIPPYFIVTYQVIEKFNLLDDSYKIRIKRIGDFTLAFFYFLLHLHYLY